jgi:hypothetical protein
MPIIWIVVLRVPNVLLEGRSLERCVFSAEWMAKNVKLPVLNEAG